MRAHEPPPRPYGRRTSLVQCMRPDGAASRGVRGRPERIERAGRLDRDEGRCRGAEDVPRGLQPLRGALNVLLFWASDPDGNGVPEAAELRTLLFSRRPTRSTSTAR